MSITQSPLLFRLLAVAGMLGCLLSAHRAFSEPPKTDGPAEPLAWPTLNLRSSVIQTEQEAYGDVFAPLWQNEGAVMFLQPYSSNTTGKDTEMGAGLGFRTQGGRGLGDRSQRVLQPLLGAWRQVI